MRWAIVYGAGVLTVGQVVTQADANPAPIDTQSKDFAPCACDLTQGSCDVYCCCDPDCAVAGYQSLIPGEDCKSDGVVQQTIQKCYSTDLVANVVPRADLTVLRDDLRGLLCVVKDNSATDGMYHTNPWQVTPQVLRIQKDLKGRTSFAAVSETPAEKTSYAAGDELWVQTSTKEARAFPIARPDDW